MKPCRKTEIVEGGVYPSLLHSTRAFTLIELMIVVAIIGILASLAISAYDIYTKKSKVSEVTNALGASLSAAQLYHSQEGLWPGTTGTYAAGSEYYDVCRNTFGVALPTTYVADTGYTWQADDTSIAITATFRTTPGTGKIIGADINGQSIILSSGSDGGARHWDGDLGARYRPKN